MIEVEMKSCGLAEAILGLGRSCFGSAFWDAVAFPDYGPQRLPSN